MIWRTPPRWSSVELGFLGDWMGGRTPDRSNPAFWAEGTVPWISPKAMKGDVISGSLDHVTEAAVDHGAVAIAPAGSVLLVVRSGILKHSVPVAVTTVDCAINQDIRALLPAEGVDATFVAAQLRWRQKEILDLARKTGVTVDSLEQERLIRLQMALPPYDEQVAIGRRLGEIASGIDASRNAAARAKRKVDGMLDAVAERTLACAEEKYATMNLERLLDEPIRTGLSIAGSSEPPGVPALRLSSLRTPVANLEDVRYLPLPDQVTERHALRDGDVLVARGSGTRSFVGRASLVRDPDGRTIYPDTAFRIRVDRDLLDPEWLVLVWNAPAMRKRLMDAARTTAGIWKIGIKDLLAVRLPAANRERQQKDLRAAAEAARRIARAIGRIERASLLLDRSAAAVHLRAFSGMLVKGYDGDARELKESLLSRKPSPRKRSAPKLQLLVEDQMDALLQAWPAEGRTFAEVREQIIAPYEQIKDAVFRRLAQGRLEQRFDTEAQVMRLVTSR